MSAYDALVIGGGHNGLVAATLLARGGLKTLVLERRSTLGGSAVTEELHPGFRLSALAHSVQLDSALVAELGLSKHGLELIEPDPYLFAPLPDGRGLLLAGDTAATLESIRQFSERDARTYPEFRSVLGRISSVVSAVLSTTPPDIEERSGADLWTLLKLGGRLRGLGRKDAYRLLRWAPMSVADFVAEWFESEPLRAALAARGLFGTALGPRSAGSTAVLLMQAATADGVRRFVRGGLGTLASALAAACRAAGADIRVDADVARINARNKQVTGVTLASGETLQARIVVSNADPRHTLLDLVGAMELDPGFIGRLRSYRAVGTVAKVNLALSGMPQFTAASAGNGRALSGSIHIGPDLEYLERAFDASKYGMCSERPYLDIAIPSVADPSLAPAGSHVMSINAQFAPYRLRGADWQDVGPRFADAVINTLAAFAPNIRQLILKQQIITPADLERKYGLSGGHIFHGELSLDQLFTMRPLLGWARYRTPITGLFLCGAGTHPGYGVSGLSGRNASREILKHAGSLG